MAFGIDDFISGFVNFAANENLQDQAQGFNAHQAALTRDFNAAEAEKQREFNSAQALAQRDWQQRMSNTAVRRNVRDLTKAGFNPLLAIHPGGGATTPSGAAASGGAAHATPASSPGASAEINLATASQVAMNEAAADKLRAEAEEVRERTPRHAWDIEEIKARIPLHQEQVQHIRQQITQSQAEIEKIYQDISHSKSSAANLEQQTRNLQATLPLIKAQITNLKALSEKASAETAEIKQRITANLPQLERSLGELEALRRKMEQPAQANAERAADSYLGQLGAYLKHVAPIIPGIGLFLNPRGNKSEPGYKPDWDGRKR